MIADFRNFSEPPKPTFADIAAEWLHRREWDRLKRSTLRDHWNSVQNELLPRLGAMPLAEISPEVLHAFRFSLSENSSRNRTYRVLLLLKAILNGAYEDGLISTDPGTALLLRRPRRTRPPRQPPPWEDVRKLIAAADRMTNEAAPTRSPLPTQLKMSVETGIRSSERRYLIWLNVDFERCELSIPTPRYLSIGRRVPITVTLSRELARLAQNRPHSLQDLVFPSRGGGTAPSGTLRRALAKLQMKEGLVAEPATKGERAKWSPPCQLGDLRLIAPTWWHSMGVSGVQIRRMMGLSPTRGEFSEFDHLMAEEPIDPEITLALERQLYG